MSLGGAALDGPGDTVDPAGTHLQNKIEDNPPASNPWKICAQVVGGIAVFVFLGLALTTVLQAAGVISLPDSMEWIVLAAEGNLPQLLGVVATTAAGCGVGILLIAFGTMKQSDDPPKDDPPTYISHEDYVSKKMPANHYWYHPNEFSLAGTVDLYVSDADGNITCEKKSAAALEEFLEAPSCPAWFKGTRPQDEDLVNLDKFGWLVGLPVDAKEETYKGLPPGCYKVTMCEDQALFVWNNSQPGEDQWLLHQILPFNSDGSALGAVGIRFAGYLYTQRKKYPPFTPFKLGS